MNPAANASYNAVIKDDGTIVSLVPEHTAAYAHGRVNGATWPLLKANLNPNLYTLSLARTGSNQNTWTGAQLEATLRLLKHWGTKYGLPLRRPYIFGHFEIDALNRWYCPGQGFFDRVIYELENDPETKSSGAHPETAGEEAVIWHRVIAGSFRNPENAEHRARQLRERGIDAFIVRYRREREQEE